MPGSRKADAYDREVGLRVRLLRVSCRMSQSQLGDRLGITFQQVQKYETGSNRIGAGRLQRIAEIFGVPIRTLFRLSGREPNEGVDPFEVLRANGAVQLLEAYGRIRSRLIRRAFLRFAEQVALTSQRSNRH